MLQKAFGRPDFENETVHEILSVLLKKLVFGMLVSQIVQYDEKFIPHERSDHPQAVQYC